MAKKKSEILNVINQGPYQPDWESLTTKDIPQWFHKAKFGIFIHWGLYSIPAFNNEWYSRNMYIENTEEYHHHIKTYGPHHRFGYQHFIPMFKAENYDPTKWAKMIKSSQAKYVFSVAEHHDGFQMYKSDISTWNAFDRGPNRDLMGELKQALEKEDIHFCASSHRAEHWFFMSHGKTFNSDIKEDQKKGDFYWPAAEEKAAYDFQSEPSPSEEFLDDWLERTVEIIDQYQPELLYFDWWVQHQAFSPYIKLVAAYYYNQAEKLKRSAAICYKHQAMAFGSGIIEMERGKYATIKHFPWQTETAIANNSWCYTDSLDYKTAIQVITLLIDVVSKNGNLLLNIGPKGDGSIPAYEIDLLKSVGDWLNINGEAIFDSKPYILYGEGPTSDQEGFFIEKKVEYTKQDIRFTTKNGYLYVFVLNPTHQNEFEIVHLAKALEHSGKGVFNKIKSIEILGNQSLLSFEQNHQALVIKTHMIKQDLPIVFKVIFD